MRHMYPGSKVMEQSPDHNLKMSKPGNGTDISARSVRFMSPESLDRKRRMDRVNQRLSRARTKQRVVELEQELQELQLAHQALQEEVVELRRRESLIKDILQGSGPLVIPKTEATASSSSDLNTFTSPQGQTNVTTQGPPSSSSQSQVAADSNSDQQPPPPSAKQSGHPPPPARPSDQHTPAYDPSRFRDGGSFDPVQPTNDASTFQWQQQQQQQQQQVQQRQQQQQPQRIPTSPRLAALQKPVDQFNPESEDNAHEKFLTLMDRGTGIAFELLVNQNDCSDIGLGLDQPQNFALTNVGEDIPMINGSSHNQDHINTPWLPNGLYQHNPHYHPNGSSEASKSTTGGGSADRTMVDSLSESDQPLWSVKMHHLPPENMIDRLIFDIVESSKMSSRSSPGPQVKTDHAVELASPSFPSVASLLNPNDKSRLPTSGQVTVSPSTTHAYTTSDTLHTDSTLPAPGPIATGLGRHGRMRMTIGGLPERMAILHNLSHLIRWHIQPTQANWEAMLPSLRPTDMQRQMRHHAWIDCVYWPEVRDEFLRRQENFKFFHKFREEFNRYFSVNWNRPTKEVFRVEDGQIVGLNPDFVAHLADVRNWTVDKEWTGELAFLNDLVPRKVVR